MVESANGNNIAVTATDKQDELPPCQHPGCTASYTRIEHLDRHVKSHDPAHSYRCEECGKSFARTDVLQRHLKIHERDRNLKSQDASSSDVASGGASTTTVQARARGLHRVSRACRACASAKAKCSGERPCQRCTELSRECEFDPSTARPAKRVRIGSSIETEGSVPPTVHINVSDAPNGAGDVSVAEEFRNSSNNLPSPPPLPDTSNGGLSDFATAALMPPMPSAFPNAPLQQPLQSSDHMTVGPSRAAPSIGFPVTGPSSGVFAADSHAGPTEILEGFPSFLEADLAAAFYLPTNDSMFWSSFLTSPPAAPHLASSSGGHAPFPDPVTMTAPVEATATNPQTQHVAPTSSALLSGFTEPSPTSSSSPHPARRSRIMITAAGLPSRHGSPRPESEDGRDGGTDHSENGVGAVNGFASGGGERAMNPADGSVRPPTSRTAPSWPMVWDPTGEESAIRLESEASLSLLMIGGATLGGSTSRLPKFDEDTRIALLETLRFADLSDDEYHAIYRSIAKIPLSVFDLLCGLYFQHFHRVIPMFHVASFSPKKTLGQLLMIILGVGSIYAPVPGAFQLGRVLIEVARRGVEHLINRDNRLARSLPIAQCQLLTCIMRWIGSARTIEMTEALCCVHVAILRRLRVFDESLVHKPVDDSPTAQWKAFIANEERRRTALATFVLEAEVTALMHTPPILTSSEIRTLMPCPEALWEANTAESWLEMKREYPDPMPVQHLAKLLASESSLPLPGSVSLGPFGAHVLIQGLHLMVHNARQLHLSGLTNLAELVTTQVRRSLCRLSRGIDEFTPRFGGNSAVVDDPNLYAAPRLCYHLAHLSTHIPLEELDLVALKAGEVAAIETLDRWTSWMSSQAERGRTIALHAGQIIRIIREHPTHATFESSTLFYAGLCLYIYSRSLLTPQIASTSQSPPDKYSPFPLDSDLQAADAPDTGSWLALGGPASLADLTLTISSSRESSGVSIQILRSTSRLLTQVAVIWRIGHVFAVVLDNLIRRDEAAAARMAAFDSAAAAAFG
ncbi:hypothetical protein JCM10908_003422 [Rhodotorula pacifica]|uniref:uncharacterized protein n=1 Tax=Rhodotorula pacifica TaxID=1495444 RepID=UPI0031780599